MTLERKQNKTPAIDAYSALVANGVRAVLQTRRTFNVEDAQAPDVPDAKTNRAHSEASRLSLEFNGLLQSIARIVDDINVPADAVGARFSQDIGPEQQQPDAPQADASATAVPENPTPKAKRTFRNLYGAIGGVVGITTVFCFAMLFPVWNYKQNIENGSMIENLEETKRFCARVEFPGLSAMAGSLHASLGCNRFALGYVPPAPDRKKTPNEGKEPIHGE